MVTVPHKASQFCRLTPIRENGPKFRARSLFWLCTSISHDNLYTFSIRTNSTLSSLSLAQRQKLDCVDRPVLVICHSNVKSLGSVSPLFFFGCVTKGTLLLWSSLVPPMLPALTQFIVQFHLIQLVSFDEVSPELMSIVKVTRIAAFESTFKVRACGKALPFAGRHPLPSSIDKCSGTPFE